LLSSLGRHLWVKFLRLITFGVGVLPLSIGVVFARKTGNKRRPFEDCESNVLQLKSSFLSSLLDWAVFFVSNFSSYSLVDFVNFLDFRPIMVAASLVHFLCTQVFFFINKLIFIKKKP